MPEQNTQSTRIHELDSIRGIAAFTVIIWHCYNALSDAERAALPDWLMASPLRLFLNGYGAVIVFYVLSGYVLALPLLRAKTISVGHFCVRRLCRIYIPYVAASLFAAALYMLVDRQPIPGEGIWPNALWRPGPLNAGIVWPHWLMAGTVEATILNPPSWTLVHEMRISLIFPLLVVIGRRLKLCCFVIGLCFFATQLVLTTPNIFSEDAFPAGARTLFETWVVTMNFIPCFLVGIALAQHHDYLCNRFAGLSEAKTGLLWLTVLMLLTIFPNYTLKQVFCTISAALIIVLAQTTQAARAILRGRRLLWLGKVSYSLYLINAPILFATLFALNGYIPAVTAMILSVIFSLAAADLMYRLVERPSQKMGSWLTKRN